MLNGDHNGALPNDNLHDWLRRYLPMYRLGGGTGLRKQPAVVVDGVIMGNGVRTLSEIRASDVSSVTILRSLDATTLYGTIAGGGAIIVETNRGSHTAYGRRDLP